MDTPDLEMLAREMFPSEYAAITDDQPMDQAKVNLVKAELARRRTASLADSFQLVTRWPEVKLNDYVTDEAELLHDIRNLLVDIRNLLVIMVKK